MQLYKHIKKHKFGLLCYNVMNVYRNMDNCKIELYNRRFLYMVLEISKSNILTNEEVLDNTLTA